MRSDAAEAATPFQPVTPRAVPLGLPSTALLCGVTPHNDDCIAAPIVAGDHHPLGSFFLLAVHPVLRALAPDAARDAHERPTAMAVGAARRAVPSPAGVTTCVPG